LGLLQQRTDKYRKLKIRKTKTPTDKNKNGILTPEKKGK
jgi:hypothetical protein